MNLARIRTYRKHSRWSDGLFWKNPVLIGGLALPLAIIVSHNLKSAAAISILMACSLIPTVLFALLIGRRLPQWIASMLYMGMALALIAMIPGVTSQDILYSMPASRMRCGKTAV